MVGAMKYFACRLDDHNGFGLLIGHTLSYFTARRATTKGFSTATPKSAGSGTDGEDAFNFHVQYTVTLPHVFGFAPKCFSMANYSLYGVDMAIIGGSNGVLGVVVMHDGSIVYAPDRSPEVMNANNQRSATTTSVWALSCAARSLPSVRMLDTASTLKQVAGATSSPPFPQPMPLADRGVGTVTWIQNDALVFVGFTSGQVEWYRVTTRIRQPESKEKSSELINIGTVGRPTRSGCVTGAFPANGDMFAGMTNPSGANHRTSDSFPHHQSTWVNRQSRREGAPQLGSKEEHKDGWFVDICSHYSSNYFAETGGFVTSEYFPATGLVLAAAERALYVFTRKQPETTLCCVPRTGCTYISCHPSLPLVACLGCGNKTPNINGDPGEGSCALQVLEWTDEGEMCPVTEICVLTPSSDSSARCCSHLNCSWNQGTELQLAVCNMKECAIQLLNLSRAEEWVHCETVPTARRRWYEIIFNRELHHPLRSLVNAEFILPRVLEQDRKLAKPPAFATDPAAGCHERKCSHPRDSLETKRGSTATLSKEAPPALLAPNPVQDGEGCLVKNTVAGDERSTQSRTSEIAPCRAVPSVSTVPHVIVVNTVGEIAVTPLHTETKVAFFGLNSIVAGIGATVCAIKTPAKETSISGCCAGAPTATITLSVPFPSRSVPVTAREEQARASMADTIDIEEHMRKRLAAGFGVPAAANVEALTKLNGTSAYDVDERVLFSYIAIMEKVGLVRCDGPVPSIVELLTLRGAPNTTQLTDMGLLPHNTAVVCRSSTSQNDSRRLLLLHLLNWIPSRSESPQRNQQTPATRADVERAVVVDVLHRQRLRAATYLRQQLHIDSNYSIVAGLIENYDKVASAMNDCAGEVREPFLQRLSPWLRVVFTFEADKMAVYKNEALPFWDRVAIALILEHDTKLLVELLRNTFAPLCNMVQELLLFGGISAKTCQLMQTIVDCTGDFQLAACLFARIGVHASATRGTVREGESAFNRNGVHDDSSWFKESSTGRRDEVNTVANYWALWSGAYRSFLDNEREFVKRVVFDQQCQNCSKLLYSGGHGTRTKTEVLERSNSTGHATGGPVTTLQLPVANQRRCYVCSSSVRLGPLMARSSYAHCAVCGHGGHIHHLQAWFLAHQKCAAAGCGCHCAVDGHVS